jgi:hypothetical protein
LESGFELKIKDVQDLAGYVKNPNIPLEFKLKGTNFDNDNAIGDVTNEISNLVKLNTDIILETDTYFSHDPENPDK